MVGDRGRRRPGPTLLYGYGGFEISLHAVRTAATIGRGWLERGGVYVVANIRGGGEYGPQWHQAALQGEPAARPTRTSPPSPRT